MSKLQTSGARITMISKSISNTAQFAQEFLAGLCSRTDAATIVGLYGDLGSGKTSFVQQVAKILGVHGSVQSPTFVIIKNYKLKIKNFDTLVHIDAYRLDSGADLKKLGWDALAGDPTNLIFIEWAERAADILPLDHARLHFEFVDDTTRKITLE
ncbi:MAG: tRNA (adenosine(37)-N6)-threonylcarbamoyltransferase complex ATPase subunit type 1 TsaE [bacterium]|nr:tRNA (adenosine(37)-N6)-threonylcarbamoyltransferase complex ATPase subunit type 1 TsaE [bacterium]